MALEPPEKVIAVKDNGSEFGPDLLTLRDVWDRRCLEVARTVARALGWSSGEAYVFLYQPESLPRLREVFPRAVVCPQAGTVQPLRNFGVANGREFGPLADAEADDCRQRNEECEAAERDYLATVEDERCSVVVWLDGSIERAKVV
jgi:hypothetical protein